VTGDPGEGQNPDEGDKSPFEQLFAAFGAATGQPGGVPDLSTLLASMQRMLAPHEGPVNWPMAREIARNTVAQAKDPSPSAGDHSQVADAVRLAELWLDDACTFPAGASSARAWSRAEWVEATMPVWQRLVEPVASHVVEAMQQAIPEEAKAMAGPFIGMLGQAGGAMFGSQVGQAIGGLAGEVVSASEVGLPLGPAGQAALVVENVREFGAGLGVEHTDVLLYLALRECAYQRLFSHVPWLPASLTGAVEEYGRGISIDMSAIEGSLSQLDPSNVAALQEALSEGLFEPQDTEAQRAALSRLETALALVEGWVDEVVGRAAAGRMPSAPQLQEAVRRRRGAGGPAEQTFASLVGLELRPRRLRDAATLWGAMRSAHGDAARDRVWSHPDLMPSAEDLDDPLGFAQRGTAETDVASAAFDAALADLLDSPPSTGSEGVAGTESDGPAE
jgi:putative hydrolase